jgi:hypothetical protein
MNAILSIILLADRNNKSIQMGMLNLNSNFHRIRFNGSGPCFRAPVFLRNYDRPFVVYGSANPLLATLKLTTSKTITATHAL